MNIFQSNSYKIGLEWSCVGDEPKGQGNQQVQDQQS